jgi:serpin B
VKSISQTVLIAITLMILAGCICPSGGRPPGLSAQSDKKRIKSPDVPAPDQAELVGGNSVFAFDLYHFLKDEKAGNLFYSPHSISLALAMTYAGARGETEQQMADTLHYTLPQDRLHPAFNWLDLELASRGEGAAGKDDGGFRLNIANTTWGQEDYAFLPEFLDTLALNHGAGMQLVDFTGDPEAARVAINDWVSSQTEERIKDLIPPGVIDELTRLVLTNAIYFNAAWAEPFDESQTQDGAFHLLDGSQVTVPMMHHTASYGYAEGEGYQAVELPYDGGELSMVILLPNEGAFDAFESSLDAGRVDVIVNDLTYQEVALTNPKFEIESDFSLVEALAEMGMPIAFSMDADFSGMDGTRELYIGEVLHKSFITVDEAGTEAAAATAVEMQLKGAPMDPVTVTVNRPFIFFIRDIETGAILFVGRVVDPSP